MAPVSAGVAIAFEQVSFGYAGDRLAVDNVTLQIAAGERVALVGANGAGKTTLMMLALGVVSPSHGSVSIESCTVTPATLRAVRRRIAYVFADPDDQLFCDTVLDEVAFGPRQTGLDEVTCLARARSSLAAVGLADMESREPLALSLGEKKSLAIATALASQADASLLDEPTSGLDPRARRRLISLLASLPGTVLLATHDLDAALDLGARVIVMDAGRVAADGPAASVLRDAELLERHQLELPLSVAAAGPTTERDRTRPS